MSRVFTRAVHLGSHQNLALGLRLILGAIFLLSATAKLAHQAEFTQAVQNYEILPVANVRQMALLISWLELEVGALLLAGLFTRIAAGIAGVLMLGFLALMGLAVIQGKNIDCGCFTGIMEEMVGTSTILRDLAMIGMLPPILLWPRHRLSLDAHLFPLERSLPRNLSILCAFLLVVLGLGYASASFGPVQPASKVQASTVLPSKLVSNGSGRLTSGWLLGEEEARVRIVVFSDFQCPGCLSVAGIFKALVSDSGGQVALIYHHYPLRKHEFAQAAAEASEAAGEQGRFWEMHDAIFSNQEQLSETALRDLAAKLGLDLARYDASLASGRPQARVLADVAEGQRVGVAYTPYVLVDGKVVSDFNTLVNEVERKLANK